MASQKSVKSLHDKEMSAVTHNIMEQRVLEKSLQTLQLEQSYALKLLELDNRIIKVHYKKLKERVSKIKSHLPAEDISKFRDLDMKGKLKPAYGGMSLSSAVKIAAASRRLNLNDGRSSSRRHLRSALPRISVLPDNGEMKSKSSLSVDKLAEPDKIRRSNSVTGVFIDASQPNRTQRPGSASVVQHSSGSFQAPSPMISREQSDLDSIRESVAQTPAATQDTLAVPKGDTQGVSEERIVPLVRATTAFNRSHSPFSSHVATEKDARAGLSTAPAYQNRVRRLSHVSHESIDSNLGENVYEGRRQELLEEENVRAATLDKRTKLFLKDVEDYLLKNPPLQASHVAFESPLPEPPRRDSLESPPTSDPYANSRRPLRMQPRDQPEHDGTPTFFPEFKYKERLLTLWKDMNKCRYLRVPDEKIDLSGVNTLVKDQMKLFDTLRQAERTPLKQAWEI